MGTRSYQIFGSCFEGGNGEEARVKLVRAVMIGKFIGPNVDPAVYLGQVQQDDVDFSLIRRLGIPGNSCTKQYV